MRLKVHFDKTDLVRVFDVDAKSELLEDPALRFDDLVLQRDVVRVQDHRLDRPEKKNPVSLRLRKWLQLAMIWYKLVGGITD